MGSRFIDTLAVALLVTTVVALGCQPGAKPAQASMLTGDPAPPLAIPEPVLPDAPDAGSFGAVANDPSVAADLARLDALCWSFTIETNRKAVNHVQIVASFEKPGLSGGGASLGAPTLAEALRQAIAKIEPVAAPDHQPTLTASSIGAIAAEADSLSRRCWFVKLAKSSGWLVSAKALRPDQLIGTQVRVEDGDFARVWAEARRRLDEKQGR